MRFTRERPAHANHCRDSASTEQQYYIFFAHVKLRCQVKLVFPVLRPSRHQWQCGVRTLNCSRSITPPIPPVTRPRLWSGLSRPRYFTRGLPLPKRDKRTICGLRVARASTGEIVLRWTPRRPGSWIARSPQAGLGSGGRRRGSGASASVRARRPPEPRPPAAVRDAAVGCPPG